MSIIEHFLKFFGISFFTILVSPEPENNCFSKMCQLEHIVPRSSQ